MNKHFDIDRTLYFLKQRRGENITFRNTSTASVDIATGLVTTTSESVTIKKAIVTNHSEARKIFLSSIGDGEYDLDETIFIVDAKDLSLTLDPDMQIIYNDRIYNIKKISRAIKNKAFIIRAQGLENYE